MRFVAGVYQPLLSEQEVLRHIPKVTSSRAMYYILKEWLKPLVTTAARDLCTVIRLTSYSRAIVTL